MTLLTQLREEASRLADEAAPEVVAALEHIGNTDTLTKVLVALIGRIEENLPSIIRPIDAPLAAALTTHVPSDEEVAAAETVAPNPAPVVQGPVSQPPVVVHSAPAPAPSVDQLEAELAAERAKVAALQQAATPAPAPAPTVEAQS